jgi:hypothetical protein
MATSQADFDNDGGTLAFDADVQMPVAAGAPTVSGSVATTDPLPPMLNQPEFTACVADDGLNRFMHRVWQAGVFDLTIDPAFLQARGLNLPIPLTVSTLAFVHPGLTFGPGAGSNPLVFELRALMPPTVAIGPTPGMLELSLGEYRVSLEADLGLGQGQQSIVEAAVHFRANGDLVVQGNLMTVDIGTNPYIDFEILSAPVVFPWAALRTLTQQLVPLAIPLIVQQMPSYPIPVFQGITVNNLQFEPSGNSLLIKGDIP